MNTVKINSRLYLTAIAALGLIASAGVFAEETTPRTFCRFVPERSGDFAWENDKIAFRAYGPALRAGTENGGVDCWLKRVDYPIIDKWYAKHVEGGTYHEDSGEGYDPYHVGASLGCGGIGLWIDDKLITTETFVSSRVIANGKSMSVFDLNYAWEHGGHGYALTKTVAIKEGDRLFYTTATFRKDGEPAENLPVAIGLTTHEGGVKVLEGLGAGWLACWETIDGSGLGTGVVMDLVDIKEYRLVESDAPDQSHALLLAKTDGEGAIGWWSGYGWERAGEIVTEEEWIRYLNKFASMLQESRREPCKLRIAK